MQANSNYTFDADAYTAKAGVVQFDYSGAPDHTLVARMLETEQAFG